MGKFTLWGCTGGPDASLAVGIFYGVGRADRDGNTLLCWDQHLQAQSTDPWPQ